MTCWLINSAVLPSKGYGLYTYQSAEWRDLAEDMRHGFVESRIGYPETAALIERMTGYLPTISKELFLMLPGDRAYIVRMPYRTFNPTLKGQATGLSDEEWEISHLVLGKLDKRS